MKRFGHQWIWVAVLVASASCATVDKKAETSAETKISKPVAKAEPSPLAGTLEAKLEPRSDSQARGWLRLQDTPQGVLVEAEVENISPGPHGFHIHEKGDCSASDASSAGGHFNPTKNRHGRPSSESHEGDFGNIVAGPDKRGRLTLRLSHITSQEMHQFEGKAVILHEKEDDLRTQPTGNAGGRIACGVLSASRN